LIRREGTRLIIEPIARPADIVELLAEWKKEAPLGPEDRFPDVEDIPARPEKIF
jgi:antitoxin VapB